MTELYSLTAAYGNQQSPLGKQPAQSTKQNLGEKLNEKKASKEEQIIDCILFFEFSPFS